MYLKGFFFTKTKSLLRRLKSLFSNTFSPFSINLEPKRGMLLLFWCFLKLLAVVDHSQMRLWGNFFLSEHSLNEYHPGAGMVWQYLRKLFNNFSTMLVTVWLLCGLFCKDVSKFIFVSVRSFLGCLWSFLRSTTLSYSSSSWMDRRNSILLFASHSHSSGFKVKGLKLFYSPSQKKYYILVVLVIFVVPA